MLYQDAINVSITHKHGVVANVAFIIKSSAKSLFNYVVIISYTNKLDHVVHMFNTHIPVHVYVCIQYKGSAHAGQRLSTIITSISNLPQKMCIIIEYNHFSISLGGTLQYTMHLFRKTTTIYMYIYVQVCMYTVYLKKYTCNRKNNCMKRKYC